MKWSDVGKAAAGTLPAIGTALGGPLGGILGTAISKVMGVENTPDAVAAALGNPEMVEKLKQMDADLEKARIDQETQVSLATIGTNTAEVNAASGKLGTFGSLFVAGWRPGLGWSGAIGVAWVFWMGPMIGYFAALAGKQVALPTIDTANLMLLVAQLLGLGWLRTQEKKAGVDAGH
jgi:hypothetical protein